MLNEKNLGNLSVYVKRYKFWMISLWLRQNDQIGGYDSQCFNLLNHFLKSSYANLSNHGKYLLNNVFGSTDTVCVPGFF